VTLLIAASLSHRSRFGRGGATWVRDRGGEKAAVLATVGESPPVSLGSGHRRQTRSARRSWDPIDAEGQLLANRATEIVGRVDAATKELAAQVGLQAGRVRLAANASVLSTIVPKSAATLARAHPGIELSLIDLHPDEALPMLRHGEVDVALIYRHADDPVEEEGFRLVHVADDPIYLVSQRPDDSIANHRHSAWIGGCERCRDELITVCRQERFTPRIAFFSDDMVVVQALVAAGIGVTTLPGLALQAHRLPDAHTTELTNFPRQIYAVTYGEPPDPPATIALIQAIRDSV
jgi:DNA-binding transcriptional LysR family regulator